MAAAPETIAEPGWHAAKRMLLSSEDNDNGLARRWTPLWRSTSARSGGVAAAAARAARKASVARCTLANGCAIVPVPSMSLPDDGDTCNCSGAGLSTRHSLKRLRGFSGWTAGGRLCPHCESCSALNTEMRDAAGSSADDRLYTRPRRAQSKPAGGDDDDSRGAIANTSKPQRPLGSGN
eukprot:6077874-Prymnesium_polylepis.1